ncbi:hypothetical protein Tco_0678322 [Tanacetum coccineum]|uniref:Retrovirus-related Pol polyprotein from transposon TNT 1-94 n=1 Tax=Tanacetum coccineum TaxID=301880 RepID=A0ABQ4XFN5_9ASTR
MGRWYLKDSGFELIAYSDVDHAGCNNDCKSTSGGIQFLGDKLVIIWMRTQLLDYGFRHNKILMYCDSKSEIAISCNPVQHSRTKHINIRYHFMKEHVEKGTTELYFVRTEYQLADLFTKALPRERFEYLVHRIVFHMAQQVILADQLIPKFQGIRRCKNCDVLKSIPCSPECKIVGHILVDHPLSYALTATVDIPAVYLQQFCKIVHKVPNTKDTIIFKLDTQEITYIVDMFHTTLQMPVETPENPFVALVNIEIIETFMHMVGYQGIVDKKFTSIPPRFEEDYHSIKDDIPLVCVYTTGNVTVRGMLIPNAFLTKEIRATDDYKEYETVFVNEVVLMNQPQQGRRGSKVLKKQVTIKQKQVVKGEKDVESYADKFAASMIHDDADDFGDRIEPGSHKEHPKVIDDDDDNKEEKKDEKQGDEMGSLEIRIEKMHTPFPITPRSPRINLSSNKNIAQELTNIVSLSTPTTSKAPHKKKTHFQDMERKCVTTSKFYKVHGKVDQVLHEIIPQLAERATYHLIESILKPIIADNIIQDAKDSTTYVSKQQQQQQQEWDAWEEEIVIDEDEVIPEYETPELIAEFQNVDKSVPTIFDHARIEATLNDMLSNQFRNAEENPNEPPRYLYNKDLFFLKNGNTKEKKYILSLQKIHVEQFPEADLEEKMNRWVNKEFKNFNEDAQLLIKH